MSLPKDDDTNNASKFTFKFFIEQLGNDGIFVGVLGFSFVSLLAILTNVISDIILPHYFVYAWIGLTFLSLILLFQFQELREKHSQLILFYFGIGIMATVNYLQFLNNFSDHFIFFYWTMAVSVSLGITNFRLLLQIWAVPLFMVLFATYYADIPEADKLRFYIWNPVITIMSCFGVYNSMKTKREAKTYKLNAEKYEFEYENLLNTLSTMVVIKDDKNTILRVNNKHAEMVGQETSLFKNVNLYDITTEAEALRFHKEDLEIINTKKAKTNIVEKLNVPNSDKEVWLRVDKMPYYNQENEICGVMTFSHDITEEVAAKLEKEKTEAQFEQVFAEAPYGILVFNEDNHILQVNSTFEKMTGFDQGEIIDSSINNLIESNSSDEIKEELTIVNGFQKEINFKTKTGESFVAKLTVSYVKNNDDKLDYSIGILEDITEKKNAEKQLADYSKALQQSNKDLEQFAYAASHDLKEPLRMVNSYVTLIAKMYNDKLDERGIEFINYASDGVKRMNGLISDLLEYSRIGRSEVKNDAIKFDNLLLKVMNNLRVPINEKKVDFDINVDLSPFKANRTLISMLFQNIISNGIKYNENQPLIKIESTINGDFVEFSIQDNGIGIDKKFSDKIFQVFQRLHSREQYEGSGIGLAICKRIVQKHGGQLWVDSEIGVGSTFYFTLPYDIVEV